MRQSSRSTKYPGVFRVDAETFRVTARLINPKTGKKRHIERVVRTTDEHEAVAARATLIQEAQAADGKAPGVRLRVGDFARSWIESKAPTLSPYTSDRYVDALDNHALVALGDIFLDMLTSVDVQGWINKELAEEYKVDTVRGWFRVFRTMIRDAELNRDPTLRISFPSGEDRADANAINAEQLAAFLAAVRQSFPFHYAIAATLAYTGLRFSHVSAFRWEDLDEEREIILLRRKQVRGKIGPVSRRKPAPRQIPLPPELAAILKEHRQWMLFRQAKGLAEGWMFPSKAGTLRTPGGLWKAWQSCAKVAKIPDRFTVHGLRRTFNDLSRRAGIDAVVIRSMTGHVTERMREHYSTVDLAEKRKAMGSVIRVLQGGAKPKSRDRGRDRRPKTKEPVSAPG